jgi:hypothetical protein
LPNKVEPKAKRTWVSRLTGNRTRAALVAAGTIVVLAGVILGVSALSAPKSSVTTSQTQLSPAEESELAYRKGMAALESGQTTEAVAQLEKAVRLDSGNSQASQALEDATQSDDSPSNSSDDDGTSSKPDGKKPVKEEPPAKEDPAFLKATDNLKALLPTRLDGYSFGTPTVAEQDALIAATPAMPSSPASRALWSVHDRGSAAEANKYIKNVSKAVYAKDPATVAIDGASAYFGTDGARFACVTYVRGRYVFEVVLTSLSGSPKQLKSDAQEASRAFPDKM